MFLTRETGDEKGDHLIADELIDEAVPSVNDPCGSAVEARDELRELVCGDSLGKRSRSTNVGEEEGELDLCAPRHLSDLPEARAAETAVQARRAETHELQSDATRRLERREAELAAGPSGDPADETTGHRETARLAHQRQPPDLVCVVVRLWLAAHGRILNHS